MRIIGFQKEWPKLKQDTFSTFRYFRLDKDWTVGEEVQIVIKPRSPKYKKLGVARIVKKELRSLTSPFSMVAFMRKTYKRDYISRMNKLTLVWVSREVPV